MSFEQNPLFAGLLLSPTIHKHCTPTGVCYTQTRPIACSTISRPEVGQTIIQQTYLRNYNEYYKKCCTFPTKHSFF